MFAAGERISQYTIRKQRPQPVCGARLAEDDTAASRFKLFTLAYVCSSKPAFGFAKLQELLPFPLALVIEFDPVLVLDDAQHARFVQHAVP